MIKKLIPDMIAEDIYSIDYDTLYTKGIRLLIFDIDGTILRSFNFDVNEKMIEQFANLRRRGFTITLLTNAGNRRLDPVLNKTKIESGFALAKKPKSEAFARVIKSHDFLKEQIAMIGNDLYMDIYGANNFGITSVLVNSLDLKPVENRINNFILTRIKNFRRRKEK